MKPIYNRAPFTPNTMTRLPLGSIRPEGWLLEQLKIQKEGFTGPLYRIWDDVGESCKWLGGDGDGWERAPYYLEGLVALAWTLNDEELKARAKKYVDWIIASQREDGWFGPEDNDDYWPLMLAVRALIPYFTATDDRRVLVLMDKFFRYEYKNLATHHLRDWAVARGGENMYQVEWLYNLTGQKYLLELLYRLQAQTLDWANYFHTFSHTLPMSRTLPWARLKEALDEEKEEALEGTSRPYFHTQYHFSHGVNIAMGLKTPAVVNLFKSGFKEQGGFKFGWQKLMKYHGVANGMFTCDEHLSGGSPSQGTETCSVVELMYTLETLLELGDFGSEIPDYLEKIAYNALPAAFTADMRAHQYDQQVNQVRVSEEPRKWYNNGDDSNLFGFEPNYGCCTANAGQGWPRFVSSLWYATNDNGIYAVSYAPSSVRFSAAGVPARVTTRGCYPFDQEVEIEVAVKHPVDFPIYLRVPSWARSPMIYMPDGEIMQVRAGETACLRRKWNTGDVIRLDISTSPRMTRWYHQSMAVEMGPLLMAYQPEEIWKNSSEDVLKPIYSVETEGDWNFALVRDEPMKVVYQPENAAAFGAGEAAIKVCCKAVRVKWPEESGSAASVPMMPDMQGRESQVIELVPYGGTAIRIAQFPAGNIKKPEKIREIL